LRMVWVYPAAKIAGLVRWKKRQEEPLNSREIFVIGWTGMRGVVRRFCANADYVIAPSRHTRDALRLDGVFSRFAVVPNGIIAPILRPEGREEIRNRLCLTAETPLLLCVGRLGPEKRVDVLVRAIALLQQRALPLPLSDFRLVLVGDGQCRAELEAQVAESNLGSRVVFIGAQPHESIGDWYAAADIAILSSPAETQGLVLVEAMSAGLPCVAADYGGPREVVVQNETGLRVPLDPKAFADALEVLMRDPSERLRLGENGRKRAAIYSPEAMADGILAVYNTVLNSARPPLSTRKRRLPSPVESLKRRRKRSAWRQL